jgi:hypothetical protein
VGKVVVGAFVFFVGASVWALREVRTTVAVVSPDRPAPTPTPTQTPTTSTEVYRPLSRVVHEAPPWVKYAAPAESDDVVDVSDRCPDQARDNDDGCPEPIIY